MTSSTNVLINCHTLPYSNRCSSYRLTIATTSTVSALIHPLTVYNLHPLINTTHACTSFHDIQHTPLHSLMVYIRTTIHVLIGNHDPFGASFPLSKAKYASSSATITVKGEKEEKKEEKVVEEEEEEDVHDKLLVAHPVHFSSAALCIHLSINPPDLSLSNLSYI